MDDRNDQETEADRQARIINDPNADRQDLAIVIQKDAEFRSVEVLKLKFSKFTGVAIKCKFISPMSINNLCIAVENDATDYANKLEQNHGIIEKKETPKLMLGLPPSMPEPNSNAISGIKHLHFFDVEIDFAGVSRLRDFLIKKPLIETIGFHNVKLSNAVNDFKKLMEGIRMAAKMRKVTLGGFRFDQDVYGKVLGGLLTDGKQIKELELVKCGFEHNKFFFDMCAPLLTEKCRLNIFRLKKCQITNIEAKVLQYVLMKNRQLHTMEFTNCYIDPENIKAFIHKFDGFCQLKFLTIEGTEPEFSSALDLFAETLGINTRMEVLQMREMKLRTSDYVSFWDKLELNRGLKKISVAKTEMTDKVVDSMCRFVAQPYIPLIDLDVSRNQITDSGLTALSRALLENQQIKYLNLAGNQIREKGILDLVKVLNHSECRISEMSLNSNKINSDGIAHLAKVLPVNKSMEMLDIGNNEFNDHAFQVFASALAENQTLELFDISRNKDLSDELSLVTLIESIAVNTSINTIDMNGLLLRKNYLKNSFLPALKKNISLKFVLGKYTPEVIDEELQTNITIEKNIMPRYKEKTRTHRGDFRIRLVDRYNTSSVNISHMGFKFYEPALKFVMFQDIRICNFTGLNLQDYHLADLCEYLKSSPNLRSLILDDNELSDDGLTRLAFAIRVNQKLAHLSFRKNKLITDEGLTQLCDVIAKFNTVLFQLNFDESQFSEEITARVKRECALNRAIQELLKPKQVEYTINDASIATVSHRTIKALHLTSIHMPGKRVSKEVLFVDTADVATEFESALKCWRIYEPSVIQVEGQDLTDEHVGRLLAFLKGKNMINYLNLRRNKVTNEGAKMIAEFLIHHDQEIFKIDVQRNLITEVGAKAMLHAAEQTVRLLDMKLFYGNRFSEKIDFAMKAEIQANMQIISNRDTTFEQIQQGAHRKKLFNVVLQDFGPEYTRSAIKSVRLLNILHLALPDNSIGVAQTRMLANMIKSNPALKSLNLSNNRIDAESAILLGEALTQNDRLLKLDLSGNEMGDLGILNLLRPLIKQRYELNYKICTREEEMAWFHDDVTQGQIEGLKDEIFKPQHSLYVHPDDLPEEIQQKNEINHFKKQVKIMDEMCKYYATKKHPYVKEHENPCCLANMNLCNNKNTFESYKAIWQLLESNQEIFIQFDSPEQIANRLIRMLRAEIEPIQEFSQENPHGTYVDDPIDHGSHEELMPMVAPEKSKAQADKGLEGAQDKEVTMSKEQALEDDEGSGAEGEEQDSGDESNWRLEQIKLEKAQEKRERQLAMLQQIAKMCCWKGYLPTINDPAKIPPYSQIMLWRFYQSQMKAHEYVPFRDPLLAIENKNYQTCMAAMMYVWYIFYYMSIFLPLFIDKFPNFIFLCCYYTVCPIWEMTVCALYGRWGNFSVCSQYAFTKVFIGNLRRVLIHVLMFKGILALKLDDWYGISMGLLAGLIVLITCYVQIKNIAKAYKDQYNFSPLRPLSKKNEIIARAADFCLIEVLYRKMSLQGTERAKIQAQQIAISLNPDLKQDKSHWIVQKWRAAVRNAKDSIAIQHILYVTLPMLVMLIIASIHELWDHTEILEGAWVLWSLDFFATLFMIDNTETLISQSVDSQQVYNLALERNPNLSFNDDERWYDESTGAIVDPDVQIMIQKTVLGAMSMFGDFANLQFGAGTNLGDITQGRLLERTNLDVEDQEEGAIIQPGHDLESGIQHAPTEQNSPKTEAFDTKTGEKNWLEDKVDMSKIALKKLNTTDSSKEFGPRFQGDLPEVNSEGEVLTKSGNIVVKPLHIADKDTIDPEFDA